MTDRSPHIKASSWPITVPGVGSVVWDPREARAVGADSPSDRVDALRHGWSELLNDAESGRHLVRAACVTASLTPQSAGLLIAGEFAEVASVLAGLSAAGWAVVSDTPAALTIDESIAIAVARPSAVIVGRARAHAAGLSGEEVRPASTSLAVDVPRATADAPVRGIVHVEPLAVGRPRIRALTGRRRFDAALHILIGGRLSGASHPDGGASVVDRHLLLADIPAIAATTGARADDTVLAEIAAWWQTVGADK